MKKDKRNKRAKLKKKKAAQEKHGRVKDQGEAKEVYRQMTSRGSMGARNGNPSLKQLLRYNSVAESEGFKNGQEEIGHRHLLQ